MKKYVLPAALLVIPACFLFLFSCNKSKPQLQKEVTELCAIKRVSYGPDQEGYSNLRDTITFSYDRLGRPVSSIRTNVGSGNPRYLFRYDERGNLRDFIGAYGGSGDNGGGAEFWTRYFYSKDNRTEWDTTYTLVLQTNTWPPIGFPAELTTTNIKKYDEKGRLIQRFTPFFPPIVFQDSVYTGHTYNYIYDAKGNVDGPGITYDDKINYHRTNKVWQFIDDQYSENNPFPIDAYDVYGLPVKFNFNINPNPFPVYNPILFGLTFADAIIEYDCDLPKGLPSAE